MNYFHLEGFGWLPESRRQQYAFYKMVPLEDGFPGRVLADGTTAPHPIYGTYLIRDFLNCWFKDDDEDALKVARKIGDATLKRMESYRGSLIFPYRDEGLLSATGFYSGLTQARYLMPFFDLWRATKTEKYRLVAEKVFQSLLITTDKGGVCRPYMDGAVIEEFPHEVPNFVLNGWTTAIVQVLEYARASGDPEAQAFGERNMNALRRLLPFYDLPDLANSRYRLAGNAISRLLGSGPFRLVEGSVQVGPDAYPIHAEKAAWENSMFEDGANKWRVETVLSRITFPEENSIRLTVEAEAETKLTRYYGVASYDGFTVRPRSAWERGEVFTVPAGRTEIVLPCAWDHFPLVGAPTNFSKKVQEADGSFRQRNVYHYLHLSNLQALYDMTGDEALPPWIAKWSAYTTRWPEMEVYSDPRIDFAPVGAYRIKTPARRAS